MSTTDLPDLYARVIAKRPELAVPHLSYRIWPGDQNDGRWLALDAWECESEVPDAHAAALILARWVEALPEGHDLSRNDGWEVCPLDMGGDPMRTKTHPSPIEALAAFYVETKDHAAEGAK